MRCGKCETVFDALASLTQRTDQDGLRQSTPVTFDAGPETPFANSGFQTERVPMAGAAESAPRTETVPAAETTESAGTGDADGTLAAEAAESVYGGSSTSAHSADEAQAPQTGVAWPVIDPVDFPAPEVSAKSAFPETPGTLESPAFTGPPEPIRSPQPAPTAPPPAFDFGPRAAVRRSRWWTPLAGVFLLALLGQATYYFRGAIAFLIPETKPYIFEVCAELGCEIPLPRRAELISIETSDLQADPTNPGIIVLAATLRNRAAFPQTFPALELTLTNERDQPLARRVLQAGDYLADKTEAFEGSSEKQIRLNIEAGSVKASGYRLYLFYP